MPVQAGLKVLQDDGKVFACYDDMWDTIYHSEVGASRAVLNAGYTLDSLMLRYKGVDWRNQSNWGCNGECVPSPGLRGGPGVKWERQRLL